MLAARADTNERSLLPHHRRDVGPVLEHHSKGQGGLLQGSSGHSVAPSDVERAGREDFGQEGQVRPVLGCAASRQLWQGAGWQRWCRCVCWRRRQCLEEGQSVFWRLRGHQRLWRACRWLLPVFVADSIACLHDGSDEEKQEWMPETHADRVG